MKKCKHCNEEIAKSAKVCPKCGGKQGMSGWLKAVIIIVVIFVCVIGCVSAFSNAVKETSKVIEETVETVEDNMKVKVECTTSSQYLDEYGFSYYVEGSCVNNGSKDYDYLQVEYICYDAEGNNLGTALDNTNNLLAGQTWKFKAMSMVSDDKAIDHCDFHEVTGW